MNPRDLLLLEKHNARPARRAWTNGRRRSIDWYGLVLPVAIIVGSIVAGAVLWFAFRHFRIWWPL